MESHSFHPLKASSCFARSMPPPAREVTPQGIYALGGPSHRPIILQSIGEIPLLPHTSRGPPALLTVRK